MPVYLITGIMAAGKSSVAQGLAERFDRSVHVRGDTFRRSIVNGRAEMTSNPSAEAREQLRLRYQLAVSVADQYAAAGYVTVMQDIILGPMLAEVVDLFETEDVRVVVLCPSAEVVTERESMRPKTGYTSFTPSEMDRALRHNTPRIGRWIDSSELTVSETVDAILEHGGWTG